MTLDGVRAKVEARRDLGVGKPLRHQTQDIQLAVGKRTVSIHDKEADGYRCLCFNTWAAEISQLARNSSTRGCSSRFEA